MEHTQNYNLPQWAKTDRIMMDDFNQAMADIDSSISAVEAKADAAYKPGNLPYVVGTYAGDGTPEWIEIDLGFRPRMVIVTYQQTTSSVQDTANHTLIFAATNPTQCWKLTENGFAVRGNVANTYGWLSMVNAVYTYIAFR